MRWINRLDTRLALMLSIALLPLGLLALSQTNRIFFDSQRRLEAALLGNTLQAVAVEQQVIQSAIGVAEGIAAYISTGGISGAECTSGMQKVVAQSPSIVFAGFIGPNGILSCASDGAGLSFVDDEANIKFRNDPKVTVGVRKSGRVTGQSVIIVTVPVFRDGFFAGGVSVSVPHNALDGSRFTMGNDAPYDLITFNDGADILTSDRGVETVEDRLPYNRAIQNFVGQDPVSFTDVTRDNTKRVFSVVPIVPGTVYAMASWSPKQAANRTSMWSVPYLLFPLLMWLASLSVAYFAVHRLVVRHIGNLRNRMRLFTQDRRTTELRDRDALPSELREVTDAFDNMTTTILHEEAELENALHEKTVLLKEVHHRVKNNLQLICSIINMQMRKTELPETRQTLRRLQDRVMGLAAIHRNLYQANSFSKVRADTLLEDVIRQTLSTQLDPHDRIEIRQSYDPVTLYPDQAMPLALVASELVTDALRHVGIPEADGSPWVTIRLSGQSADRVKLAICYSNGKRVSSLPDDGSDKLSQQLIMAFLTQLEGEAEQQDDEQESRLVILFRPSEFEGPEELSPNELATAGD